MSFEAAILLLAFAVVGIAAGVWGARATKPERARSNLPARYIPQRSNDL